MYITKKSYIILYNENNDYTPIILLDINNTKLYIYIIYIILYNYMSKNIIIVYVISNTYYL